MSHIKIDSCILRDWQQTAQKKAIELLGTPEGASKAAEAKRYGAVACEIESLRAENERLKAAKDNAYLERNKLVALLSKLFPSGLKRTAIEGWSEDWHGCVYIDFPWGQASWHYHDSQAPLFSHLGEYWGEWDGHTTEEKYAAIDAARKEGE